LLQKGCQKKKEWILQRQSMNTFMNNKLTTHISEICWCNPTTKAGYKFETAKIKLPSKAKPQTTAWLDELLDGGFAIPVQKADKKQALGILITGPPGTGKSTFALELAYRWSCIAGKDLPSHVQEITSKKPLQILYATLEATPDEMIQNARSYKWKEFITKVKPIESLGEMEVGQVNIISFEHVEMEKSELNPAGEKIPIGGNWIEKIGKAIKDWSNDFSGKSPTPRENVPKQPPDVLIIDSLNSIPDEKNRELYYKQYAQLLESHPLIVIFILDSSPTNQRAEFWEFASDVVIRLDRQYDQSGYMGYMIRNIEIVKARFQYHAWGRHQLKIYKGSDEGVTHIEHTEKELQKVSERMRSHPYRTEGGIFIFPSIHFVLSGYKHIAHESDQNVIKPHHYKPRVPNLKKILGKGFPMGRCTAMIGERGGHKSHLGYVEVLYRLVYANECETIESEKKKSKEQEKDPKKVEKALIVSLRDDEGTTRRTMTKILNKWREHHHNVPELEKLETDGLLEITYFPPGYITPEEFFHRLLLSINRLKHADTTNPRITLLFNSLDQLSSRFPLCAKEPIFIPGIIQMLAGEEVSSFFVAAREEGRSDYYGLDSMAELILEFEHRDFPRDEIRQHLNTVLPNNQPAGNTDTSKMKESSLRRAVVLTVGRFAGGQSAGAEGILELLEDDAGRKDLGLNQEYASDDLIFIPRNLTQTGEFGTKANRFV
jgi:KaiC/GvpD/RAD55 family RecA-like ATPase